MTKSSDLRLRAGIGLASALGLMFVALGMYLALAGNVGVGDPLRATWQHLFGIRDAFLGLVVLSLIAARERRALFLFICLSTILPIVDTVMTAADVGWSRAAVANLPYELPLLLLVWLLWLPPGHPGAVIRYER